MATRVYPDGTELELDYQSPRVTSEWYECGLPMTFDQYNKCAFNCQYCFSAYLATKQALVGAGGDRSKMKEQLKYRNPVRAVNPDRIREMWASAASDGYKYSQGTDRMLVDLIRRRTPVHWGGLCDPFDPFERKYKIGLEMLEFWRANDWPVVFSTKGHQLMCEEPWASVLRNGNFRFQFSITAVDAAKGRIIDSGVGTPDQRLEAMAYVTGKLGLTATLRLRPIVPGVISPEEACTLIRRAHDAGATGVSTEFFCLEARGNENRPKYERMSEAAGFDLFSFYQRNSKGQSGYLRLNRAIKEQYFLPMARVANELGMRFSVSDKEFKELGNVSGCCGVFWDDETQERTRDGHDPVFINKGTVTYALIHARKHGRVRWSDVEPTLAWAKHKLSSGISGLMDRVSARSAHREQQLYEVLRAIWNDPNQSKSPYRYSGGKVVPVGKDDDNNVIYEYRVDGWDAEVAGWSSDAPDALAVPDVPLSALVRR